ncbi:hypothetical protein PV755_09335 [Streptomyces caniscabiei]|uniref:Uncharacterized protein n=1 Tax=Streptomyces caniscabiei TaxID=2746961 RepID=A0A927QCT5_9ACTN|nr:hypothetical protein [Streptomyces caniscabiei]MBD9721933.1 hypothetical protein [Streptomyces caniscabiei]MDX3509124.1 hypothetical protein [Streptomyces caniscabiei]MDX3717123.1 hypothetical protein [Streptomyces caniscabiei]WEO22990.1 hypothetical protein IHE65_07390 [Streptomyces caniscabiei]
MSTADHVLDQINSALNDYTVSDDAMRSQPEPPAAPKRGPDCDLQIMDEAGEWHNVPGVTTVEIQIEYSDTEFQNSIQALRENLARIQVERARQVQEMAQMFARAYVQAMKPAMEAAAAAFAEVQKAVQHANPPLPPGRRHDRPAWQSPYGPPQRRR